MKKDKYMKKGDIKFEHIDNIVVVKWFHNRGVIVLGTCVEGCNQLLLSELKGRAQKYLSHDLKLLRITTLGWAVLS